MLEKAFEVAAQFNSELQKSRGAIAIIVFGNELFGETERLAKSTNKPFDVLKRRGDMELVRRARSDGRFVLTMPDYAGGLEFDGVILVGVDNGRVPPKASQSTPDSDNFLNYATHQKLYVAITRAKYRVAILGVSANGPSPALESALSNKLIDRIE